MKLLALSLLLASCMSSSPQPAQPPPSPEAPPTPSEPAPTAGAALGQPCGDGDACAIGLTCVSYYGIAGPRGPEFKSCEIKCKADDGCPAAHRCVTIADGPGQVCRPTE